jgi:uncharacterized membrane protein (GlpM family)
MITYFFSFLIGGAVTVAVVAFEVNGLTLLSRLALLFPVTTWISYLFIADSIGGEAAVSKSALFLIFGTLVAWIPYMFLIYYLSPKIGVHRTLAIAIAVFVVLALIFSALYKK